MMLSEDCGCTPPAGFVKALRIAGGLAEGRWGKARVGEWAMIPRSLAESHPEYWQVQEQPESHEVASQDLSGLTAPEPTDLAAEAGIELPKKASKSEITEALQNAPAR